MILIRSILSITGTPNNGSLPIGNGQGFTINTLTAGTNITITNGPGTITIDASGGGGGTPAGNSTEIQYNNAGAFGANSNLKWDITNNRAIIGTEAVADTNSRLVVIGKGQMTNTTFAVHNSTGTNNALVVRDDGLIGIGTATPTARLNIFAQGALETDLVFRIRNSANNNNLALINGIGDIALSLGATGISSGGYRYIAIGTNANSVNIGLSIGANAGQNQEATAQRNILIGNDAGRGATSGTRTFSNNICIGNAGLLNATTGAANILIGNDAGRNITTANDNICIGYAGGNGSAGQAITTGGSNIFIGANCGNSVTTATGNTALGVFANFQNVTGAYNTQIGYAVHVQVNNKSYNVGLGMRLRSSHDGTIMIGSSGAGATNIDSLGDDLAQFHFRSQQQSFFFNKNTNVVLRSNQTLTAGTHYESAATNVITIHKGTAPVANITDAFALYSADIVAGNAAPHFRTGNGSIIKLYQETTGIAAATLVSGGGTNIKEDCTFDGYTIGQVVKALRNAGLLA